MFYVLAVKATRKPLLLEEKDTLSEALECADEYSYFYKKFNNGDLAVNGLSIQVFDYPAHEFCEIGSPTFMTNKPPIMQIGGY